jgi:signal transduction histidine kinase
MKSRVLIFISLVLALFAPTSSFGFELERAPLIYLKHGKVEVLRDATKQQTFEEVRELYQAGGFTPIKGNLTAGYVPDAYWLRFEVDQSEEYPVERYLEVLPAYLDRLDLYHVQPSGVIETGRQGDFLPLSSKENAYRANLFKLHLQPGRHEVFLRIQTTSSLSAELKLWAPEAFAQYRDQSYFYHGFYFSALFSVLIFNFVSWLISRKIIFITYVAYLGLNSLQWFGISGFTGVFLLPENPLWANLSLGISLALSSSMAFIFFSMLLGLREHHRYIYWLNMLGAAWAFTTAVVTPMGLYQKFAPLLLLVAVAALLLSPWPLSRLWREGSSWNRLFVAGYLTFSVLLVINIFATLSIIEFSQNTVYVGMAANLTHIFVLYLAILLHYRNIEHEHAEALKTAEVAQRQADVERLNSEERKHFYSVLTHEIRTPLAIINSSNDSLKIIESQGQPNPERLKRYDRISGAIKRINLIWGLVVAQRESHRLELERTDFDLFSLTKDVIAESGRDARERVDVSYETLSTRINADEKLIRIALFNLIENALKYSPQRSKVEITLRRRQDSAMEWRIDDQGAGIPEERYEQIFDKYKRGSEDTNQPGMGLGLFIVKQIVQRHGASVTVSRSPKGGARFTLMFPSSISSRRMRSREA